MGEQERARLESILVYPEDTAGGLMSLDVLTVRGDVTLEVVLRYLRLRGEIPLRTNRLFVVDRANRYRGEMRLADLLTRSPDQRVEDVMSTTLIGIPATTPTSDVARLFEHRDLISAAVVDHAGQLLVRQSGVGRYRRPGLGGEHGHCNFGGGGDSLGPTPLGN